MKIPVYEIEGDYYCKIDDIAITKTAVNKKITLPKDVAIFCFDNFYLFINITDMVDEIASKHIREKGKECFEENIDNIWGRQLFFSSDKSYSLFALRNSLYRINAIDKSSDILEATTICEPDTPPTPKPAIKELYTYQKASEIDDFLTSSKKSGYCNAEKENELYSETTTIKLKPTDNLYIRLSDAKLYLADCGITDDDFMLPITLDKPSDKQETHTKNTDNTFPYMVIDSPNYPPYLNIAIEMWERYFINGERNREGKATNSDKENIIKLLDMHYPTLTGNAKKTISEVATFKQGENKDNFKKNNN